MLVEGDTTDVDADTTDADADATDVDMTDDDVAALAAAGLEIFVPAAVAVVPVLEQAVSPKHNPTSADATVIAPLRRLFSIRRL
ncbi:hypothetical protein [Catenulispora pinisilvae]|uniref:hypothetical protein n=1 Tax=Catenulispora pinisilvae TaxID=2705253 RepID=UPI001890F697|nr:hypothetical protein [Catenulispora pinisilvae]